MIRWITLLLLLLSSLPGYGQQASYVNHTELGPLLGKMNDTDRRVNFSIQSFNGIRIRPNLSVGFLIGMDSYPGFVLMPMAMGWRGVLDKGKRTSLYASLDVGYGSAILEEKQRENFLESWYEGGLMFSPAIGSIENQKVDAMPLPGASALSIKKLPFMKAREYRVSAGTPTIQSSLRDLVRLGKKHTC